jgi:hypothetical protein
MANHKKKIKKWSKVQGPYLTQSKLKMKFQRIRT